MSYLSLDRKGRATLPEEVRASLGLKPGDFVLLERTERGTFELVPADSLSSWPAESLVAARRRALDGARALADRWLTVGSANLNEHSLFNDTEVNIGVYEPEKWVAANNSGTPLAGNHSPLFAPVPKPTIQTGVTAMTLAVLGAFDQHARGK